jgi:hypothetical protein
MNAVEGFGEAAMKKTQVYRWLKCGCVSANDLPCG